MTAIAEKSMLHKLRLPLLFALLIGLYWYAKQNGILEQANPEEIRTVVQQWGAYGVLLYIILFSVGQLLYVPGMIFVVAAGVLYGGTLGFAAAFVGAIAAISVSFYAVRLIGGSPLKDTENPFIGKMISGLHERPIRSIALMRLFVSTAPALNYILALSAVKYRQYLLGSILGMPLPIIFTIYFTDWLVARIF